MNVSPSPRPRAAGIVCLGLLCACTAAHSRGTESTHSIRVEAGWNLLSLPADVTNGLVSNLFPTALTPVYVFRHPGGYEEEDTLRPGVGFWIKFDSAQTVFVEGWTTTRDTIPLHAGWNLIGSVSLFVTSDSIHTIPPGIIAAPVFRYTPGAGYSAADTILPGLGHWVKADYPGSLVLRSPMGLLCPGVPLVRYEGKVYKTVQIGSRCWLRANLDLGTMIPGSQNASDNGIVEKHCYDDDPDNCATYGGLYQWDEAMQYVTTPGTQGICPPGWHLPTFAEFQTLSSTVGGDGNALKAVGQGTGGGAGTNTSGFSALLAGQRYVNGYFVDLGGDGYFWSSTQLAVTWAHTLSLYYDYPGVATGGVSGKSNGFSIRCLED